MINVVLDTSIYRADRSRATSPFQALTRLLQAQKLTLHIPEWVKREVLSQFAEDGHSKLSSLLNAARALRDATDIEEVLALSQPLEEQIRALKSVVQQRHGERFTHWLSICRASESAVLPEHVSRLTDAYFAGDPPFSKAKSRTDIPDGFIWQAVLDIASRTTPLYFVVADKRFKTCAETQEGITTFESLADFIQSPPCQAAIRELDRELDEESVADNSFRAVQLMSEDAKRWEERIKSEVAPALVGFQFREEELPGIGETEVRILSVGESDDFTLHFDAAEYYGEGEFEIPFTLPTECRIQYMLPRAHYEALPKDRAEGMSVYVTDMFTYLVEEDVYISAVGLLNIRFGDSEFAKPSLDEVELRHCIERATTETRFSDASIIDLV